MKKHFTKILCLVLLTCLAICVVGCTKTVVIDGDYVVITADTSKVEEGSSLLQYMDYLKSQGILDYEISDGMILSINGLTGGTNQYWMLYTSDTANSNNAWGSCEYDGKVYDSASLGAEQLLIKDACVYIWYLQTF